MRFLYFLTLCREVKLNGTGSICDFVHHVQSVVLYDFKGDPYL